MNKGFAVYCLISAIGLIVGESWFVYSTDKYLPLAIDDYVLAAFMLVSVHHWEKSYGPTLVFACWVGMFGNLYAMLFGRLEPVNPAGRPWKLLAILVVWSGISALLAFRQVQRRIEDD